MSAIVSINQIYLDDPRLQYQWTRANSKDLEQLKFFSRWCQKNITASIGLMPRHGVNNLPFKNNFIDMIDATMPCYDPKFKNSWEEVTDQRAIEIETMLLNQKKNLIVFWSGGIDSTCILVAILKNFSKSSLELVSVACTSESVFENPVFYENHIVQNFKMVDANDPAVLSSKEFIFIDGYGADTLSMSMSPSLDVCMAVRHSDLLSSPWRTKPDQLIDYLSRLTNSKSFAMWYYEINKQNIESISVPIETYFDFMWWIGFNYDYYTWVIHNWFFKLQHLNLSWDHCKKTFIGWFRTNSYQLWALNNNGPGVKHGHGLGSLKHHAKKYIYDYDKNEFFYKYKTKINSVGRVNNSTNQKPFAITDQFEILYLEKDLDQINKLLHTHII
jgi:hypothetical protein